jgi:hypothetical protein
MQNAASAPAVAPPPTPQAITTIQTTPSGAVQISTPQPMRPLTSREMSAIRERRSDISRQLTSTMGRREDLIGELKDAPADAAPGLLAQIRVLDERIIRIEQDMEGAGQMLRTGLTVDNGTMLVPPREFGGSDDAERVAAMGAMVLVPVLLVYMVARFRRRRRRGTATQTSSIDQDARMERLEQAVDAIALEIERVGESQRYQTKVLAEANLMPAMSSARSGEPVRAREFDR